MSSGTSLFISKIFFITGCTQFNSAMPWCHVLMIFGLGFIELLGSMCFQFSFNWENVGHYIFMQFSSPTFRNYNYSCTRFLEAVLQQADTLFISFQSFFSVCFILDSLISMSLGSLIFYSIMSNLLLVLSGAFFVSDMVIFFYETFYLGLLYFTCL